MARVILLCQTIEESSSGLGTEPRALQVVNGSRVIDLWWRALLRSRVCSTDNVVVATIATHYKAVEAWAFAQGLAVSQVVNSGQSLGGCTLELQTVTAIIERATRPSEKASALAPAAGSSFLIISVDAVPPPDAEAQLQALVKESARSAALAYLPTAKGHPLHVAPFAAVCDGFAADGSLPLQCITRSADSAAALASSAAAAGGAGKGASSSAAAGDAGKGSSSSGPELWPLPGAYFLSAADAALLAEPALHAALRRAVATVASDAVPPSWPPALSVPVEVGLSWLAALGRISALPLSAAPPAAAVPVPHSSACGVLPTPASAIRTVGYARVGLLGNPSDGYGGKTLSVTVNNHWQLNLGLVAEKPLLTAFCPQHARFAACLYSTATSLVCSSFLVCPADRQLCCRVRGGAECGPERRQHPPAATPAVRPSLLQQPGAAEHAGQARRLLR